ncbi:hypothetical protein C5C59_13490 [Rathayibacter sp. AY1F4]|nr:hypothetical protein C5C26_05145 [Rathayibacter sp. AY2B1]PPG68131.1 hypothetical protein C5C59_13490 [Rathayibacter sp. AY1F4]
MVPFGGIMPIEDARAVAGGAGDRRSGEGDGGHIRSPYDSVRAAGGLMHVRQMVGTDPRRSES